MKKIQILGTGCPKCRKLTETAETAARELGLSYELVKVTNVKRFADFGVLAGPALVVNGVVKVTGRVPSTVEMKTLLS